MIVQTMLVLVVEAHISSNLLPNMWQKLKMNYGVCGAVAAVDVLNQMVRFRFRTPGSPPAQLAIQVSLTAEACS